MITLDEAEKLAMETDYAVKAVGEPINTADAGAFFFEGYKHAETELKDLAFEFYSFATKGDWRRDGNLWYPFLGLYALTDDELFDKFLAERSGNICCRCGELGATEKHGMCKKCIDFCQIK